MVSVSFLYRSKPIWLDSQILDSGRDALHGYLPGDLVGDLATDVVSDIALHELSPAGCLRRDHQYVADTPSLGRQGDGLGEASGGYHLAAGFNADPFEAV